MTTMTTATAKMTTVEDLRRQRLLAMLLEDGASVQEIADLARRDRPLTQALLHAVNAWLPRERAPVRRLEEAIVFLGLRRVGTVIHRLSA